MTTQLNYISQIIALIKTRLLLILSISIISSTIVSLYFVNQDIKIETYSKIFPLSFNKASSSPIDAIKSQFGIIDKTDYSVIYNIKELVNSKTLSTRIVKEAPIKKNKYKNLAEWLIDDYNSHLSLFDKKIKIVKKDSNITILKGAALLLKATDVNVEKTEFTTITTSTFDKDLSKEINLAILSELSNYYIQVATEKPRTDLNKIKIIRDSLRDELGIIERDIAGYQDANQLSVKYSTGIPQAKLMRDRAEIEQIYATTVTVYQNARFKLLSESPIFQILDYPGEPFNYVEKPWKKFGIIAFLVLSFILSLFVCRKIFLQIIKDELSKP